MIQFRAWGGAAILVGATWLSGCSSDTSKLDPIDVLISRKQSESGRVASVQRAQEAAAADPSRAPATVRAFATVAWNVGEPAELRVRAIDGLLSSPDATTRQEAKDTCKLILPREKSMQVVGFICRSASEQGWTDFIPAIVRSYARVIPAIETEEERPERAALAKLGGGRAVEDIVFDVFVQPPAEEAELGRDWSRRVRADAWDLLARLDVDGTRRATLLSTLTPSNAKDDVLAAMEMAQRELRVVPLTGGELTWLLNLRDKAKTDNAAWWAASSQAAQAYAGDARVRGLRHAEPIRWAAANRPAWASAGKEELSSELARRLEAREKFVRSVDVEGQRRKDDLRSNEDRLSWADLIAILTIDEAIRDPAVVASLVKQADLDRRDETTEYGGVLELVNDRPRALLYPPRPGQRQGDMQFVASDDMVARSDRALAHYHFHAQSVKNGTNAGPSRGDVQYAARSGRSCLVLTTVREGTLDVDYYQPNGVVVDLGTISVTPSGAKAK